MRLSFSCTREGVEGGGEVNIFPEVGASDYSLFFGQILGKNTLPHEKIHTSHSVWDFNTYLTCQRRSKDNKVHSQSEYILVYWCKRSV